VTPRRNSGGHALTAVPAAGTTLTVERGVHQGRRSRVRKDLAFDPKRCRFEAVYLGPKLRAPGDVERAIRLWPGSPYFFTMSVMTSARVIKRASAVALAIALAAVIFVNLGGVAGKSAVAACTADAQTIEGAVTAFQTENPSMAPTRALLTGSSFGGPFLSSWPKNGSHYSISMTSAGAVMVSTPARPTARPYDSSNPCRSAT
jgi:hypothetical protein